MSEEAAEYFIDAQLLYHPGGHGIPLRSVQKKTFNKFLEDCKTVCLLPTVSDRSIAPAL